MTKRPYVNGRGQFHRVDGPAVTRELRHEWYTDGKLHRIDGPAIEYRNGRDKDLNKWFVQGRQLSESEFYLYVDTLSGEMFVPPGKRLRYDHLRLLNALLWD